MEKINMKLNRYIFVSLLPNRCVLFKNSCHNNLVCSVRTPYFGRKSAFTQSCITLQPLQLLKKYFGELRPRSWLFGGTHFQSSIVNFIFHHFCTTLCHLIVILPFLHYWTFLRAIHLTVVIPITNGHQCRVWYFLCCWPEQVAEQMVVSD